MTSALARFTHRTHLWLAAAFALLLAAGAAGATQGADSDATDPPGRVGKISLLDGRATLTDLTDGSRLDAEANWPITSATRLATERLTRAEVRIGSTALRLDDETTIDFVRIDDRYMQIAVLRGSATLRLRNRDLLPEIEVLTERERIIFDDAGRYRFDVDRVAGITAVTTHVGAARVLVGDRGVEVGSGQRAEIGSTGRIIVVAAGADRFDDWVAGRDARDDRIESARWASREMTGLESLEEHGLWRDVYSYGPVWFPQHLPVGWAPYRYGRWVSIAPWGWTWIDQAPWGFAPFHYGRWVWVHGTWGWAPGGYIARPIYAPALVAWYGTPGVNVSVHVGHPVGWFPLGPGEPYVPWHRHSPRYKERVNIHQVVTRGNVTLVKEPSYRYRDSQYSTWVPDSHFGHPVHRVRREPPSEWRRYIGTPTPPVPGTKRRQDAVAIDTPFVPPSPPANAPRARTPVEQVPVARTPTPVVAPRVTPVQPIAPVAPVTPVTPITPPTPPRAAPPARSRDDAGRWSNAPAPVQRPAPSPDVDNSPRNLRPDRGDTQVAPRAPVAQPQAPERRAPRAGDGDARRAMQQ
jgi:hypothetical protein